MTTVVLGFDPYPMTVHLSRDADFLATIRTQDGTDFPAGTTIKLELTKPRVDPVVWEAAVAGDTATFSVDRAQVDALNPGSTCRARLLYSDSSGTDLVWFQGVVDWHV